MPITFACQSCGKQFSVADNLAGKSGKCSACGAKMMVPEIAVAPIQTPRTVAAAAPIQVMAQPVAPVQAPVHQNVQVNIGQPKTGNPVAIASLVLGILAALICWVPLLGLVSIPLAALGLILGLIGLIVALVGRRSGLTASGVGASISLVAAIASVVITGNFAKSVGEELKKANAQVVAGPVVPGKPAQPAAPGVPAVVVDEPPPFVEAGQPATIGDYQINVYKVVKGKVPLMSKNPFPGTDGKTVSQDELLSIYINVKNTSQKSKLDYKSMGANRLAIDRGASLTDSSGNTYKPSHFGFSTNPEGRTESESIYPGKSIDDHLVFELPVDGVEFLFLELPGARIGLPKGVFRFRIAAGEIQTR